MADLHKLAQAMCSVDLADSYWTQELPRLPVPDLWLTVDRYLDSLRAVLAPQSLADNGDVRKDVVSSLTAEQVKSNRRQFQRTQQLVKQFMLNEGPQLQRDLKEYANKSQNWATDYWLQDMYLSNPVPLPVNSNPFFMFPRQHFNTSEEMLMFATRIIQFSVDFKYRIDQQTLRQDFGSGHGKGKPLCMETYKNFFHSYRMPHEDVDRLLPQSRRSNHIVVASCDQFYILRLGQDPLPDPYRKDASAELSESMIFDQLLRIYRISREHARRQLSSNDSNCSGNNKRTIPKVGLFTTENRKVWAKWHKKLIHCNGGKTIAAEEQQQQVGSSGANSPNTNTESLRLIEDCLFVMCLDSLIQSSPLQQDKQVLKSSHQKQATSEDRKCESSITTTNDDEGDEEAVQAATVILTGGGTHKFTANRWFDKFLQIIVGRDGICGINIEHSASEGITVLRFLREFLEFIRLNPVKNLGARDINNNEQLKSLNNLTSNDCFDFKQNNLEDHQTDLQVPNESITSPVYVEPLSPSALLQESDKITPLVWLLDEQLEEAIEEAEKRINRLIDSFSLRILNFNQFGRGYIKSQRLSPDAFVQLALQMTFFKIHGHLVSTYESASLRQFRLGRVDNIRANTCEAYDWIQAMLACKNSKVTPNDQENGTQSVSRWLQAEEPFIKAINKQVEILKYTITGTGPDNHLLALKQLANIRYDDELPELFRDPSYKEFNNFRLSTSQLPNDSGITVGYGAVVPDGYGCSYNPCDDCIIFCISSFADCPTTSSSKFASLLTETLIEMQELCSARVCTQNH